MSVSGLARPMPPPALIGAAAIGVVSSFIAAPALSGLLGAGLALIVAAIAWSDARRFRIPNELNLAAFVLGIVHAAATAPDAPMPAVGSAVVRGAVLALIFLGLRLSYRRMRRREGIGLGDVKLAGAAGAWLDWFTMPVAIEIAALAALVAYVVRQQMVGRPARPTDRLPFGLFFAPAIWLGWIIETTRLMPWR
jgi:leader peptidase (prepilin peptidase) / N-methyltransferase